MNEIVLNQYLISDDLIRGIYYGVISCNELVKLDITSKSLHIVNTDPSYLPGSH